MTFFDWEAQADHEEKRLRRHRRSSILLTQHEADAGGLCGTGILSWRKATETTESELPAMEVVRRTLAARPTLRGSTDVIQYERRLAEWCQWCSELVDFIVRAHKKRRWWRRMMEEHGERSPATESRPRTGPRAGLPGLPRHQRTQAAPRSQ